MNWIIAIVERRLECLLTLTNLPGGHDNAPRNRA